MTGEITNYSKSGRGVATLADGTEINFTHAQVTIAPDEAERRGSGHIPDAAATTVIRIGDVIEYDRNHSQWPITIVGARS